MALKAWAFAAVLACGTSFAQAQNVDANNGADQFLAISKTFGTAELQSQDNGNPRIVLTDSGGTLSVLVFNDCTSTKRCSTVTFYAGFANIKPTLEVINNWNRDKRFGTAYLDADLDASLRFDVSLELGITRASAQAAVDLWTQVLAQYMTHVGYR